MACSSTALRLCRLQKPQFSQTIHSDIYNEHIGQHLVKVRTELTK